MFVIKNTIGDYFVSRRHKEPVIWGSANMAYCFGAREHAEGIIHAMNRDGEPNVDPVPCRATSQTVAAYKKRYGA